MLWGSSPWWTGSRSILDRLSPVYHSLAFTVFQVMSVIRKHALLQDSGLPLLDFLLDQSSQQYGLRVLLSDPPPPLANTLFEAQCLKVSAPPFPQATPPISPSHGPYRYCHIVASPEAYDAIWPRPRSLASPLHSGSPTVPT